MISSLDEYDNLDVDVLEDARLLMQGEAQQAKRQQQQQQREGRRDQRR